MTKTKEYYGLDVPDYLDRFDGSREFITGCEYEIEDIRACGSLPDRMHVVDDHSLRNGGKEFITDPMTFDEQLATFRDMHNVLKLGKDPFSERTSIHVHVNARELTLNEVRQMILAYALVEPLFFEYVGPTRKSSIYCVPLNYTSLPCIYKMSAHHMRDKWHKYTAFNISPLNHYGTIEFRHLYGTGNVETLHFWLGVLRELYTFIAETASFDIIQCLLKGETSAQLARKIVPSLANGFTDYQLTELLSDTLLDVKLSVGGLK